MNSKRKLSSLEKYHFNRSRLKLHSCFYVGIQLNELPDRRSICQALRAGISTYPQLHQNIATDPADDEPYIKNIDRVLNFDDVAEYVSDSYTEDTINKLFRTRNFPYFIEQPLWKLLVLENENKLLLLLDHVLFDGMSAVAFWKSFMKYLGDEVEMTDEDVWVPTSQQKVQEECHVYEKWPTTWSSRFKASLVGLLFKLRPSAVIAVGKSQFHFKDYSFPSGLLVERDPSLQSSYEVRNDNCQRTIHVEASLLQELLSSCRRNGVSLTSFLAALLALSMKKCINTKLYDGSFVKIDVPMNTRKACAEVLNISESSMTMGNFVAPTELQYDLHSSAGIWEVAQLFTKSLKRQATTDVISTINNVKLLDVADTSRFIQEKVKAKGPSGTFEVTNLGAQDFGDIESSKQYVVENAFFNEPQSISDIFTCSTISTPLGGLTCSLSYPLSIKDSLDPCLDYINEYLENRDFN